MFKQRKLMMISAMVAIILVAGITVFAKQASQTINIIYDNIKIMIDGVEYTARDANGNVIEPFIYNGTTYLPVRGIAEAFGKDVEWESQTSTVSLGAKNYDWLNQMGYVDYDTSGNKNTLTAWEKSAKSTDGMMYDRGIAFQMSYSDYDGGAKKNNDGTYSSYQNVEYLLNNNYKSFTGKLVSCYSYGNSQSSIIKIYGDGNLLYTSPPMSEGTKDTAFNIDVSGYKIMKISVDIPNLVKHTYAGSKIGIVDARLEKK